MATTFSIKTHLAIALAAGAVTAIALPVQAGVMHLPVSVPHLEQSGDFTSGAQSVNWFETINKRNQAAAKRARNAARKRAYEKKRRETETGQIKGKIVLTKPKKNP